MKIKIYTILRNNIDKLINIIYKKAIKETVNIGSVSKIFEIGFKRITIIIRWFYFAIFVTILTYIVSIGKYIENIFIIIFSYIQLAGKYLIEFILSLTGPLSEEIINNIWLLLVLSCILVILIIIIKFIKYLLLKIKERKKEKELFKEELIKKLAEQDEIIKSQLNQLNLLEKEKNKEKLNVNEILIDNQEEKKENIKEIKINGVIYKIDLNKIK